MQRVLQLIIVTACYLLMTVGCGGGSKSATASSSSWTNLTISGGNQQTTVSWTKVVSSTTSTSTTSTSSTSTTPATTTESYNLYWSNSKGQSGTITGVTTPYQHTGLVNGTTYYYSVTHVVDGSEGPKSMVVGAVPTAAPNVLTHVAPPDITVEALNNSVQLTLDRSGDLPVTSYNLYWAGPFSATEAAPTTLGNQIVNAFGTGTTFQHTGVVNNKLYYYGVKAIVGGVEDKTMSKIVAAMPAADINAVNYNATTLAAATLGVPNAITAVAGNQSVTLTWNMPTALPFPTNFGTATGVATPVASAYVVYWSQSPISDITDTSLVSQIVVPITTKTKLPASFTHTGLTNGTPYYYLITQLAAFDSKGNALATPLESPTGSSQIQVSATPGVTVPNAPANFSATTGTQQVTLGWTQDSNATTTYKIYEIDIPTASATLPASVPSSVIGTIATNSFTHTGLKTGRTYYYFVISIAASGAESEPTPIAAASF